MEGFGFRRSSRLERRTPQVAKISVLGQKWLDGLYKQIEWDTQWIQSVIHDTGVVKKPVIVKRGNHYIVMSKNRNEWVNFFLAEKKRPWASAYFTIR